MPKSLEVERLQAEVARLKRVIADLLDVSTGASTAVRKPMSAAARKKIAAAQKKRHAKNRAEKKEA